MIKYLGVKSWDLDPQACVHSQKGSVGPAFLVEGRGAVRSAVCKAVAPKLGKVSNLSGSNVLQPEDTTSAVWDGCISPVVVHLGLSGQQ